MPSKFEMFEKQLNEGNAAVAIDRSVVRKLWTVSKQDAKDGRETLGFWKMSWVDKQNGVLPYFYDIGKVNSGLNDEEIAERYGWMSLFIKGAVEVPLEKVREYFYPHGPVVGHVHTHRVNFDNMRTYGNSCLCSFSGADIEGIVGLSEKLAKIAGKDRYMLAFGVGTSFAEAIVPYDIIFNNILPEITGLETQRIKELIFIDRLGGEADNGVDEFVEIIQEMRHETKHDPSKIQSPAKHHIRKQFFENQIIGNLYEFYLSITEGNTAFIYKRINQWMKYLKDCGYARDEKISASAFSSLHVCLEDYNELLWKIAKQNYTNSIQPLAGLLYFYNGKNNFWHLPRLRTLEKDSPHILGLYYTGKSIVYPDVEDFKTFYRNKFGKDLRGFQAIEDEVSSIIPRDSDLV
jgi:hypothetical protein